MERKRRKKKMWQVKKRTYSFFPIGKHSETSSNDSYMPVDDISNV
jgi:hypothetical protein